MNTETKKQMIDWLAKEIKASGLSQNRYAEEILGISKAMISQVLNNWDKEGVVGDDTWTIIGKLYTKSGYKGVPTYNFKRVCEACEVAYHTKKAVPVVGEGGFGKTYALDWFKTYQQRQKGYKVLVFDASMHKTKKQFIVGLIKFLGCYEAGVMGSQIQKIGEALEKVNGILVIDEASSLREHHITIVKDIITVLAGKMGIVLAGTKYFMDNLNAGARKHKHLFSETRDRLYSLVYTLEPPTDEEAEQIFQANGITGEALNIVMVKHPNKLLRNYHWRNKPTHLPWHI